MTGNLTPTRIVNKNGVHTTVYRKPSSSSPAALSIPAPMTHQAMTHLDREQAISDIMESIDRTLNTLGIRTKNKALASIQQYPDHLLLRVLEANSSDAMNYWMTKTDIISGEPFQVISEGLCFYPVLGIAAMHSTARSHVKTLHYYKQLPESDDFSQESDEVRSQCAALMTVAARAIFTLGDPFVFTGSANGHSVYMFKDDRVTDLILEHHHRASEIEDIIADRKTLDPEVIRSILVADAQALNRGIL